VALHQQFTIDTGVQICFCDPKRPWQCCANESITGLLRQYPPKPPTSARPRQPRSTAVLVEL